MMTIPKRLTVFALALAFATPVVADKVKPAWEGIMANVFQTHIISEGLRELGYEVSDFSQVQIPLAHVSVADGSLDFFAAHAIPLHDSYFKEAGGDEKLVRLGDIAPNAVQGYLIDKPTAAEYGIQNVEQLADPEIAKLFDVDGNGKADLFGCEPGWGCEKVIEHQLDAYGLRGTVEHRQGSYSALIADVIERIQSGKPTLYYTWTPLWVSAVLRPGEDVTWLTVKETKLPDDMQGMDTTIEGIGNVGFTAIDQKILVNKKFAVANPVAKNFFENVHIPLADVNDESLRIHKGQDSIEEIRRHAEEWIANHKKQWDAWIEEAAAAGE